MQRKIGKEDYLRGSVILYDKMPVYISDVYKDKVYFTLEDKTYSVGISNSKIDLNPFPLGYVQKGETPLYLYRIPVRDWKQGLSAKNLFGQRPGDVAPFAVSPLKVMDSLQQLITTQYPTLSKCLSGGVFSREFAIFKGKVYYKRLCVGDVKEGKVHLHPKYLYLSSDIHEEEMRDANSVRAAEE